MNEDRIRAVVAELVGQSCERIENPYGSVLSIDLGPIGITPGDPPGARPHGWRHLTVLSPWRLQTSDYVLADWNEDRHPGGTPSEAIQALQKQLVTAADVTPPAWDLRLSWSNGAVLVVFGDCTDDRAEAWFILGTDGLGVSAAPVMRAPPADGLG